MTAWRDVDYLAAPGLDPFDLELVNPCSVDLRLGNTLRRPHPVWQMTEFELRNLTRGIVPRRWSMKGGLPAGVDLTVLDTENPIKHLPLWGEPVEFERAWLYPNEFVLCHSLEVVTVPDDAIALLFSKSSMGRIGLEHLHAGLGDGGFNGQWTFEFHNVAPWPIELVAGARLMQQIYLNLTGVPERTYRETGRYQNQSGPTPARPARS